MSKPEPRLDELFEDGTAIDEALREAARDTTPPRKVRAVGTPAARRFHKAIGNPMAEWRDGRVVWVQPEDIVVDDDPSPEGGPAE